MQKFMVLAAMVLFSGMASAKEVLAQIDRVSSEIQKIQLTDDGELIVVTAEGSQTIQLEQHVHHTLVPQALTVQDAELTTETRTVICKMMVPFPQHLYVGKSLKTLQITLTSKSCAFSTIVYPKEDYQYSAAVELKAAMLALAFQLVK